MKQKNTTSRYPLADTKFLWVGAGMAEIDEKIILYKKHKQNSKISTLIIIMGSLRRCNCLAKSFFCIGNYFINRRVKPSSAANTLKQYNNHHT